jgi:hypothetical protein
MWVNVKIIKEKEKITKKVMIDKISKISGSCDLFNWA